ncbi:hypothetical protein, partial [Azohydromonas lata]
TALAAALPADDGGAERAGTPSPAALQQARAVATRLEALLAEDDFSSTQLFREHEALLSAALGPRMQTLARQLDNFDFGPALATLRQALGAAPA